MSQNQIIFHVNFRHIIFIRVNSFNKQVISYAYVPTCFLLNMLHLQEMSTEGSVCLKEKKKSTYNWVILAGAEVRWVFDTWLEI